MGSRLEKNSSNVRKRIEGHQFHDEGGEEYRASTFGGFTDYMRRKKIKLQNLDVELRSQSTDKPPIFRGVVAYVNGYTQPTLGDLHRLIVSYGGGFLQYLDGKTAVTHVIVSSLTPKKKVEFARYRIVKPAWVVDSVQAGRLLPWDAYRVVDEGVKQKVLGNDNGQITSQANTQRQGYRDQSEASWYTSQVRSIAEDIDGKTKLLDSVEDDIDGKNVTGQSGIEKAADGDLEDENQVALLNQSFNDGLVDEDLADIAAASDLLDQGTWQKKYESSKTEQIETTNLDESVNNDASSVITAAKPDSPKVRQLTAEEHNAILLSNPHLAKSSTANPDFLNQYYRESRLHHLSTWKSDLKAQLQARALEKSASQSERPKRPSGSRRYIMHVDFDSFFAAVSLRNNPQLKDKPVVIAHGSGPGSEIASCNYPAREFGIKNGMWMKYALELCPDVKVLPYDFKAYEEASRHFYDAILAMDGTVQSISIDEALVDVSDQCIQAGGCDGKVIQEGSIYREQTKATELAQQLRALVREKTECEVSVGIGGNILLAKAALRKAKPAGQYLIKPEEVLDFIGELTVTNLPGVAYNIGSKLEEIGVKVVKDIRNLTKERLINTLGPKTGEKLWDYSRGIDKTEVGEQVVRKSVSAEVNWGIRFVTQQQAEEFVQCLCDELHKRLLDQGVKGKQLTMKIMRKAADAGMDPPKNLGHGKCDTFNKSIVLGVATYDKAVVGKEAISILRGYGFSPGELRGLGVQMQKLEPLKPVSPSATTGHDSSQRRLSFKKPEAATAGSKSSAETPVTTMVRTPQKTKLRHEPDLIEGVITPEKSANAAATRATAENNQLMVGDMSNHKPLNLSGTQFLMPTQIDPSVLAELPADIRAKFAPKKKTIFDQMATSESLLHGTHISRSPSPFQHGNESVLPTHSQLDLETLNELPPEVRAEVLAQYNDVGQNRATAGRTQRVLPQSPRKGRPAMLAKKVPLTPTKKQRVLGLLGRGKLKAKNYSTSTLTQSNFVTLPKVTAAAGPSHASHEIEEISPSFLEELPEDIRAEVLAEQKRNRMKAKFGLSLGTGRKRPRTGLPSNNAEKYAPRTVKLPPQPEKPTFTSRRLSTLPQLRDAMSAWVQEFSEEEPPFAEDVEALVLYLQKVVTIEMDMEKAVSVVDWVAYLVTEQATADSEVHTAWHNVLFRLKTGIQDAVESRGLPPIEFAQI